MIDKYERLSDSPRACVPPGFDEDGFHELLQGFSLPSFIQCYEIVNRRCLQLCLKVAEKYGLFRGHPPVETMETLEQKIGLAPQARYLIERMMRLLVEEQCLSQVDSAWVAIRPFPSPTAVSIETDSLPEIAQDPIFEFFRRCEENLFGFLEGKRIGAAVVFPKGDLSFWLDLNNHSIFFAPYARQAAFIVSSCLKPGTRLLEVGAGTGAATAQLLARLPPEAISQYLYTDISTVFLRQGRQRFGQHPFIDFKTYNLNISPRGQGLEEGSFDIIYGVNALHVARHIPTALAFLRALLKPNGRLVIGEGSPPNEHRMWRLDLLFGFLDGWWNVETDAQLRTQPGWLLPSRWQALFSAAGFTHVCALPGEKYFAGQCYGGVVIGKAPVDDEPG